MHELSLCRSLMRIIANKMAAVDGVAGRRVTVIWLEMGELCGVDIASLQFYFPLVAKDTLAAGAELRILTVPAQNQELIIKKMEIC